MLILLLPLTTICVSVAGFYVWHRQLIRKRHFEVADAALAAFSRSQAALIYARTPASFVGEGASRERDVTELPAQSKLLDSLSIAAERLGQHREAFAELERVAFAVQVHFGDHVAHQVREPLRAYNRLVVTNNLQLGFGSGCKPEGSGKAGYADSDRLSDEIYKAAVETALRPHLEAPTLKQFLLLTELRASARRVIAFLVSMGRRLCTLS
jgi:signal transduction histidine kinase